MQYPQMNRFCPSVLRPIWIPIADHSCFFHFIHMFKRLTPIIALVVTTTTGMVVTGFHFSSVPASVSQQSVLQENNTEQHDVRERSLLVHLILNEAGVPQHSVSWTVNVADHTDWILPDGSGHLSQTRIAESLPAIFPSDVPLQKDAVAFADADTSARYTISGVPQDGYTVDEMHIASLIAHALEEGQTSVTIPLRFDSGRLLVLSGSQVTQLERLSTGRSNFAHSPAGRAANVHKAMDEYLNGAVLAPHADFSFNKALAHSDGWYNSLIIVNGHDLVQAPGGGICQAATTVFRAAVLAGLPTPVRANHSLYVTYYKEYGVGIDATVLPGQQDLVVHNDTNHPIVLLARTNGDDATADLYGIPDGRSISINGPYFSKTAPADLAFNGKPLQLNEIGWKQTVTSANGQRVETDIVSHYLAIPKKLPGEYSLPPPGIQELVPALSLRTNTGTLAVR